MEPMVCDTVPVDIATHLDIVSRRIKKTCLALALLAMLGQNVAYAFGLCGSLQMVQSGSSGDCHTHAEAVDEMPVTGGDTDCEHGCDGLCSAPAGSTGAPTEVAGNLPERFIALPANPLMPAPVNLLFRPPISG